MAVLVFLLLLSAMAGRSGATWCICKDGLSDSVLQKTLDYACGAGADCNPTHQNGPCFNPNTVRAHCSYAVNSYFQKYRQTPMACDFAGTATVTSSDPSLAGCAYPATASSTTPVTTVPGTNTGATPTTTVSNGGSPFITTPNTAGGVLGGSGNGLSPMGTNDFNNGGIRRLPMAFLLYFSIFVAFFALLLL
ncbi:PLASMODESMATA CALLOSE-BINDING PROTEIN 3 [Andrographis paniculata]|uniref:PLASMODESMATA CALLOSE-BINDING PROTEIN 3 n=1 Tax=Andrographis paniculata TaxID=175694 RepID=UPI0021E6DA06|nr:PLASMODESMATA CALLOSE-BINDING PROTEIN 3 [Andrographis paniculata]